MTDKRYIKQQWETICRQKSILKAQEDQFSRALEHFQPHGHLQNWLSIVEALPAQQAAEIILNQGEIIAREQEVSLPTENLESLLQQLMPWRKGLFDLHGVKIDSEWRSDLKFDRLLAAGIDFTGKHILDVGCGNGYFLWRMIGEGASLAVGLDPSSLYFAQFLAVQKYLQAEKAALLPFTLDDLPLTDFDLTLSMGVLYHRREPLQHLTQLRETLRPHGLLVLETLVVEGDEKTVLMPPDRYAGMRNVWFLPSVPALQVWLQRLGFAVEYISPLIATTEQEQRATKWQTGKSLPDFMRPDFSRTIEDLPPPKRVIILARKSR